MITLDPAPVLGSIRTAERGDAAGVSRLLAAANQNTIQTDGERTHLLVLDVDGAVRAVECVIMESSRAVIQLLAVDPALGPSRSQIADRMLGVALALCEAYGCLEIEVVGANQQLRSSMSD
jgi:N-acetylglutamate synthase-like GNAT family acetyltransferase